MYGSAALRSKTATVFDAFFSIDHALHPCPKTASSNSYRAHNRLMTLDDQTCYRAMCTRDTRFDGRFFVAVSSTRIYCRPVCTVRTPRRENCAFFPSAAAAEHEGYRPCLRCRPELAPGNASVDAVQRTAHAAANLIEDQQLESLSVSSIAARIGITDRHLRRVFQSEFGVSPVSFAQTQRLLLAKRLLTDTRLPLTQVAYASGFGSVRRFNHLFRQRYRLSPGDLRKRTAPAATDDVLTFELSYRPPYDWTAMLEFLAARAIPGVEQVDGYAYRRTVLVHGAKEIHNGWIEVMQSPRRHALKIGLSASLAAVVPFVLSRVRALMDLSCQPDQIATVLGPLAQKNIGIRLPGAFDGFEMVTRAVLGQQITVVAARTLAGRFARAFGSEIVTPHAMLTHTFPPPAVIAATTLDSVATLGIIATRARTIKSLAHALDAGNIELSPASDVETTLEQLRALPGIGEWTAQYIAMRALAWPDAFPHTDLGVMKALNERNPKKVLILAEAWRPWRAYAVMHLWRSLQKEK
jgi:AraC family transcriptional regulator of adaptative response / DNA-3-methyladenine glycosylase II